KVIDTLGGYPAAFNLTYNANGQLSVLHVLEPNVSLNYTYAYSGKYTVITLSYNYSTSLSDSVMYDNNSNVIYLSAPLGTDTDRLHFYYNAGGELDSSTEQHNNDVVLISYYQYANGDITRKITQPQGNQAPYADTLFYSYDMGHTFAEGDY